MARQGILGTKLGMTQVFDENNRVVPVTVVKAGPNVVTRIRTPERDGYSAVQLAYGDISPRKVNKPVTGQYAAAGVNPRLEIFGVVMTMFDGRTKLANEVVGEVRNQLGAKVFETMIPRSTKLAEAPSFGKPIIHYDKFSAGAAAYELLAQEILVRLGI